MTDRTALRDHLLMFFPIMRDELSLFLAQVQDSTWQNRTEPDGGGWTLHETLAHVVAVAEGFQSLVEKKLVGESTSIHGLTKRDDLAAWNARQNARLTAIPPQKLVERLLAVFDQVIEHLAQLSDDALTFAIDMPMYNRPATIGKIMSWQLCHVGIVHAAQLANGAGLSPLWERYSPALMRQQITWFLGQISHSYWPDRGGDLMAHINLIVYGEHGGRWHLTMDPDGGASGIGVMQHAKLTLRFRKADAFCQVFTLQYPILRAILTGKFFATGDLRLGFRLGYLLDPT